MWPGLCLDQKPGRQRNTECGEKNAPPVSPIWLDGTRRNKRKVSAKEEEAACAAI